MNGKCSYLKLIDDYVHGELKKEDCENFERHLLECEVCRDELSSVEFLLRKLNFAFEIPLPYSFGTNVIKNMESSRQKEAIFEIKLAAEDVAIALVTLIVVLFIAMQLFRQPRISSSEIAGRLTAVEQSSLEPSQMSKDDVLELVLTGEQQHTRQAIEREEGK